MWCICQPCRTVARAKMCVYTVNENETYPSIEQFMGSENAFHCVAFISAVINHFTCCYSTWNPTWKGKKESEKTRRVLVRAGFVRWRQQLAAHKQDYLNTWNGKAYSLIETSIRRRAQVHTHLQANNTSRTERAWKKEATERTKEAKKKKYIIRWRTWVME